MLDGAALAQIAATALVVIIAVDSRRVSGSQSKVRKATGSNCTSMKAVTRWPSWKRSIPNWSTKRRGLGVAARFRLNILVRTALAR